MESSYEGSEDERTHVYEGPRNMLHERHGLGRATFTNGDMYHGSYNRGLRYGQGTYTFVSGGRYKGNYVNGRREGYGELHLPDRSRYEGNWSNNTKNGNGVYFYGNGDRYDGEWLNDKRHGYGKYYYCYGPVYDGQWRSGVWHGAGKFVNADYCYIGTYHNGLPVGQGRYIFSLGFEQYGDHIIQKNTEIVSNKRKTLLPRTGDSEKSFDYEESYKLTAIWRPSKIETVGVQDFPK